MSKESDAVALISRALTKELGHVSDRDTEFAHKLVTALAALKILDGAAKPAKEEPLRDMDLAFLEMFELFIDIFVRMGVPKEEFERQFAHTLEKVKAFPRVKYIIEELAKTAAKRASELKELERIQLQHVRPQGSA